MDKPTRYVIHEEIEVTDELLTYMERELMTEEHFRARLGEIFRGRITRSLGFDPGDAPAQLTLSKMESRSWMKTFILKGWIEAVAPEKELTS